MNGVEWLTADFVHLWNVLAALSPNDLLARGPYASPLALPPHEKKDCGWTRPWKDDGAVARAAEWPTSAVKNAALIW